MTQPSHQRHDPQERVSYTGRSLLAQILCFTLLLQTSSLPALAALPQQEAGELVPVELLDRPCRAFVVGELHEGEPPRPAGGTIGRQKHFHDVAGRREQGLEIGGEGLEAEVSYKNFRSDGMFLSLERAAFNGTDPRARRPSSGRGREASGPNAGAV